MRKFTLFLSLLFTTVMTTFAQDFADGVYKIYWDYNDRGYMAYHADYPTEAKLADVQLTGYQDIHFKSATDPVSLNWYLVTATDSKRYLFNVETGFFLGASTEAADAAVANALSESVALPITIESNTTSDYTIFAEINGQRYFLSSGCGQPSTTGHPVRWNNKMADLSDGGTPLKLVPVADVTVDEAIMAAVKAVIDPTPVAPEYTATATSADETMGTATVEVVDGVATFTATANDGYVFKCWDMDNQGLDLKENPFVASFADFPMDLNLVAYFEAVPTVEPEVVWYRLKETTRNEYMNVFSYDPSAETNAKGLVNIAPYADSKDQIFALEEAEVEGQYYLRTEDSYYVTLAAWNVNVSPNAKNAIIFEETATSDIYILRDPSKPSNKNYLKIGGVNVGDGAYSSEYYVYCDAAVNDAAQWLLEKVEDEVVEPEPSTPFEWASKTDVMVPAEGYYQEIIGTMYTLTADVQMAADATVEVPSTLEFGIAYHSRRYDLSIYDWVEEPYYSVDWYNGTRGGNSYTALNLTISEDGNSATMEIEKSFIGSGLYMYDAEGTKNPLTLTVNADGTISMSDYMVMDADGFEVAKYTNVKLTKKSVEVPAPAELTVVDYSPKDAVTSLEKIEIEFSDVIASKFDATANVKLLPNLSANVIRITNIQFAGKVLTLTLDSPITAADTYTLKLPADKIVLASNESVAFAGQDIAFTVAAAPAVETFAVSAVLFPAPADPAKVTEIKGIRVQHEMGASIAELPTAWTLTDADNKEVEVNVEWGLADFNDIMIAPKEPIKTSGTYTLNIPAGSLKTDNGEEVEAATFSFTVVAPAPAELTVVDYSPKDAVTSLEKIEIEFSDVIASKFDATANVKLLPNLSANVIRITNIQFAGKVLTLTLDSPITAADTYTLKLPADKIVLASNESVAFAGQDIAFTVAAAPTGYEHFDGVNGHAVRALESFVIGTLDDEFAFTDNKLAVNDIHSSGKGSNIFVDKTDNVFEVKAGDVIGFESFLFHGEWMHAYAYIDYNNDFVFGTDLNPYGETNGELVSFNYLEGVDSHDTPSNAQYANGNKYSDVSAGLPAFFLPEGIAPGEYRMRIKIDYNRVDPNFGDDWANNNNPKIMGGCQCDFTIKVVGDEPVKEYLEIADVTPASDTTVDKLEYILLTFAPDVYVLYNIQGVDVMGADGVKVGSAGIVMKKEDGTTAAGNELVLKLQEAIAEAGTYTITLPEGAFGDGIKNTAEKVLTFTVDPTTGIDGVDAEVEQVIYDITGRRIEKITNAGVYIVNGVKVLVK